MQRGLAVGLNHELVSRPKVSFLCTHMSVRKRIVHAISIAKTDVFLRGDFSALGSASQITRVLRALICEGIVVRISQGVYARAKFSVLTGKPIPAQPIAVLAPEVLRRLGIEPYPSRLVREYNEGRSTQMPADGRINTGRKRVKRKIAFGRSQIKYETE